MGKICKNAILLHCITVPCSQGGGGGGGHIVFCSWNGCTTTIKDRVSIALGYGLDDWGSTVRFLAGAWNFLFTTVSRIALGSTQHPIQWVPGALSLGVKQLGCEADHSPPSSAEVRAIPALPKYAFMVWCLVKHRDNFAFAFMIT
jgi:hypothetical protein